MYERTFVVFVDEDLSNDTKHVALTAAGELFDVTAEFDHETTDSGNLKWITVKSQNIGNAEGAKAYIIACFHPQLKCPQIITMDCLDILQDAHGLWWRSLEHEFKVRMNFEESKTNDETDPALEYGIKIIIQGEQEPVAFASSYITELDNMLKAPPENGEIDKANIRRDFTNELLNFKELKWEKYSSYNPYVLRTLLKWIYWIKGVTPNDEEYVLSLKGPAEDSLIVLSSDEGEDVDTETKSNKSDESANKIFTPPSSSVGILSSSTSSAATSKTTSIELNNDAKRKIDQNNANSSDDSVELLEPSTSQGAPMQLTTKKTSKRFALSTSPIVAASSSNETHDCGGLVPLINGSSEAIIAGSASSTSSTSLTISSSSRTKSEVALNQQQQATLKDRGDGPGNGGGLSKSNSVSRILQQTMATRADDSENDDDILDAQMRKVLFKPVIEKSPLGVHLRNVDYKKLRPIIIDGSNVAMQAGRNKRFSCRAILLAARYFIERGHKVYAFVPEYRANQNINNPLKPIDDQWILNWMEDRGLMVFTPSRQIVQTDGSKRRVACYDDNMIVNYAHIYGGVMLSKDNYRDVARDRPQWAGTIEKRLLMFSWVGEQLMVPVDPHGKNGPTLEDFLKYDPGEQLTPDQLKRAMDEEGCLQLLREIDEALTSPPPLPEEQRGNQRWSRYNRWRPPEFRPTTNLNRWRSTSNGSRNGSRSTSRPRQQQQQSSSRENSDVYANLCEVFPSDIVRRVMEQHPFMTDVSELGNLITDQILN